MNIYGIKENLQYKQSASLSNIAFRGDNFIKRGWHFVTGKDSYEKSFMPTTSLITEDLDYVVEVRSFVVKNGYNKQQEKSLYNKLYQRLKTNEEKEIFRQHFGKYLTEEESQSLGEKQQLTTKLATKKTTSNPNRTQVVTPQKTTVARPETKTLSKDTLLGVFEKIEKEDVPNFVAKIANGTKDTQYNLVEIRNELEKRHKELLENDPQTLFRNDLHKNKELKQKIEEEIEERFRQEGRKYSSTDIIEERIKTWKQMEKDAGFENPAPETLRLGRKLYVLENQMKEQNISFVPKTPEQFTSDDEKWKYINDSIRQISKNKASTMEALDVFEKYGERRFVDDKTSVTSLEVIETKVSNYVDEILSKGIFKNIYHTKESIELTNALLQRFIQVHSKYATNQVDSRSYPDVHSVVFCLKRFASVENKDTILMMINSVKNLAVTKEDYTSLKYFFKHFRPEDSEAINENDMPDIEKAIDELGKAVENLPDKYENA